MPLDFSKGAPQRIAIIGGGISGLASAMALCRHHTVTLFEAATRFGGHARTVLAGRNGDQPVDTGFIVFNHVNYPYLTAMFRDLDVPIVKSDMSFGVSLDDGRFEYALRNGNALFGQRRNFLDPRFYQMLGDVLRFNKGAEAVVSTQPMLTIAELIAEMGLSQRFRDLYLYPFCGAIWSTPNHDIGSFPAQALLRFMRNHGLMSRAEHHQWWTVEGGSIAYVERLVAALQRQGVDLRPGARVRSITRSEGMVTLRAEGGLTETYDQVVLASHPDESLAMLTDSDDFEHDTLSAIRFQPNRAILHADPVVMPKRRRCWSSWVSRGAVGMETEAVGVTYWMNRLQNIPETNPLFLTLNPAQAAEGIDPALIYDETVFHHPVFDAAALDAQGRIAARQGARQTWFAGAWLRNGFHEDGCASAMRIARQLLPATQLP